LILVLLGVIWAGVLIHWIRTRRPLESLSFGGSRGAMTLGRDVRRAPVVPLHVGRNAAALRPGGPPVRSYGVSSEDARQRRRLVLLGLGGFAALTLFAAVALGGAFFVLHLLADAMLLGYVVAIVAYQREVEAARLRVRPLHRPMDLRPPLVATGTEGRPVLRRAN
jgi:hypothetical protein